MPYDTPYNRMIANNQNASNKRYADYHAYSNEVYNSSLPFSEVHKELRLPHRRFVPFRNVISNYDGGITNRNMEGSIGVLGRSSVIGEDIKRSVGKGHCGCASCGLQKCSCMNIGGKKTGGFFPAILGAIAAPFIGKAVDAVADKIGLGDRDSSDDEGDYEDYQQFVEGSKKAKLQDAQKKMREQQARQQHLARLAREQDAQEGIYNAVERIRIDSGSSSGSEGSREENPVSQGRRPPPRVDRSKKPAPKVDRTKKPKGKGDSSEKSVTKKRGRPKKTIGGSVLGSPSNDPVNKGKISEFKGKGKKGGQKYMKSTGLHWEGATLGAGKEVEGDIKEVMVASKKGKGKKTGSALFKTAPVVPLDVKSGNPPTEEQIEGIHDFKEEPMGMGKAKKGKKTGGMLKSEMKGSTFSGGAKTKKANPWIEHVKAYAKKHNVKYSEAIKLAKASYKK